MSRSLRLFFHRSNQPSDIVKILLSNSLAKYRGLLFLIILPAFVTSSIDIFIGLFSKLLLLSQFYDNVYFGMFRIFGFLAILVGITDLKKTRNATSWRMRASAIKRATTHQDLVFLLILDGIPDAFYPNDNSLSGVLRHEKNLAIEKITIKTNLKKLKSVKISGFKI